jgi:aldose 1-epimerase
MSRASAPLVALTLVAGIPFAHTASSSRTPMLRYTASQKGNVVRLHDTTSATAISILPSMGNLTVEMKVKGHDVLRFPHASPEEYTGRERSTGIPFLAPWADRLDEQAFYANGKRYAFDMSLGNIRGANPIHGFLSATDRWQIKELEADETSARVTSRLEFFRNPAWMKQFPFAHTIEMTHRLRDGVLEVATRIENLSIEPMPVAVGFHPYFQLTDSLRDEWTLSVAARTHWPLTSSKMPTGETQPIATFFPDPDAVTLKDFDLDDVFSDLVRDQAGRAAMTLKGKSQRLDIVLGPNYRAVVIYAPRPAVNVTTPADPGATRNFICIEPVAAIINALNLAHRGQYRELQSIAPSGVWQESFWIRPSGFEEVAPPKRKP